LKPTLLNGVYDSDEIAHPEFSVPSSRRNSQWKRTRPMRVITEYPVCHPFRGYDGFGPEVNSTILL